MKCSNFLCLYLNECKLISESRFVLNCERRKAFNRIIKAQYDVSSFDMCESVEKLYLIGRKFYEEKEKHRKNYAKKV